MSDVRKGHTSASSALPDSLCAGRHLAQQGLPDVAGKYSASGALVHAALAGWTQPQDLPFAERETFDACRTLEKKLVIDYFGEQPPSPIRVIREAQDGSTRLWARFGPSREYEHSGQPDVIYRSGTRALIIEYKTLAGDVPDSSKNLQLRDQAVLVYGNHTLLDEIATAVVQPLVSSDSEITTYDRPALVQAQNEMFARVVASNNPKSPRTAGEVQCEHCKAKRHCLEYQRWASAATPPQMLALMDVPVVAWTPEQRATAAAALAPAQKFLDDLKEFIKDGLKSDPNFCPGFTLKPGNNIQTITDPQACFDRFAAMGGKLPHFMGCVKLGKEKLKEAVQCVTGAKGKALDKAMAELTSGICKVTQNEPSLARVKELK